MPNVDIVEGGDEVGGRGELVRVEDEVVDAGRPLGIDIYGTDGDLKGGIRRWNVKTGTRKAGS